MASPQFSPQPERFMAAGATMTRDHTPGAPLGGPGRLPVSGIVFGESLRTPMPVRAPPAFLTGGRRNEPGHMLDGQFGADSGT